MKLGKLVAKGVAEDVLDAAVEESRPAPALAPETETVERVPVERVTAGSSAQR